MSNGKLLVTLVFVVGVGSLILVAGHFSRPTGTTPRLVGRTRDGIYIGDQQLDAAIRRVGDFAKHNKEFGSNAKAGDSRHAGGGGLPLGVGKVERLDHNASPDLAQLLNHDALANKTAHLDVHLKNAADQALRSKQLSTEKSASSQHDSNAATNAKPSEPAAKGGAAGINSSNKSTPTTRYIEPLKLVQDSTVFPWLPGHAGALRGVMRIEGRDYPWEVLSMQSPRAFLIRGLLSNAEADELRESAAPALARSTVIDLSEGKAKSKVDPWRTSKGMFMISPEQERLPANVMYRSRIAKFLGLELPWVEKTQVLNYQPGEFYKPHEDYFSPYDEVNLKRGGQRIATTILYLNQVKAGGETSFPKEANRLKAKPNKGDAIVFYSVDEHGRVDPASLHEGRPPEPGSEKWIAVLWCHPRPFF